jgi:TolA-binding protein
LKSKVPVSEFQELVSALEGTAVKVTNKNFRALSLLCEEFRFRDLSVSLSRFRESGDYKEDLLLLSMLEEQMQQRDREIAALQADLSRQSHLVENLENALREVRELAEGAQQKAASTEAQLGRVGRLEAEVSALRTAPVVPTFEAKIQCPGRIFATEAKCLSTSITTGPHVPFEGSAATEAKRRIGSCAQIPSSACSVGLEFRDCS